MPRTFIRNIYALSLSIRVNEGLNVKVHLMDENLVDCKQLFTNVLDQNLEQLV